MSDEREFSHEAMIRDVWRDMVDVRTGMAQITTQTTMVIDLVKEMRTDLKTQGTELSQVKSAVTNMDMRLTDLAHDHKELKGKVEALEHDHKHPPAEHYLQKDELEAIRKATGNRQWLRRNIWQISTGALVAAASVLGYLHSAYHFLGS